MPRTLPNTPKSELCRHLCPGQISRQSSVLNSCVTRTLQAVNYVFSWALVGVGIFSTFPAFDFIFHVIRTRLYHRPIRPRLHLADESPPWGTSQPRQNGTRRQQHLRYPLAPQEALNAKMVKAHPLNAPHTAGLFCDMSLDGPVIGTLVIIVDRAKNLPNRKTIGKQDPYCAARLGKEAKKTTTDIRGGQTPRW